jgi:hypothetical protein
MKPANRIETIPSYYELLPPLQQSIVDALRMPMRNLIAWLQGFLPMYQMKLKITMRGETKEYDAYAGTEYSLRKMKKRVNDWNQEAMNCGADPKMDHAFYVRIR